MARGATISPDGKEPVRVSGDQPGQQPHEGLDSKGGWRCTTSRAADRDDDTSERCQDGERDEGGYLDVPGRVAREDVTEIVEFE